MSRRRSELIKQNLWSSSEAVYNYGFLNAKSCVYAKKRIKHGKKKDITARREVDLGLELSKNPFRFLNINQKDKSRILRNSLVLHIYRKCDVNGCVNKIR